MIGRLEIKAGKVCYADTTLHEQGFKHCQQRAFDYWREVDYFMQTDAKGVSVQSNIIMAHMNNAEFYADVIRVYLSKPC